jgi:hypothetical protein
LPSTAIITGDCVDVDAAADRYSSVSYIVLDIKI